MSGYLLRTAVSIGVVTALVLSVAGPAAAQSEFEIVLLGGGDDPDDADVRCGGDADEGVQSCERTFSDNTVEKAWIYYCAQDADCDGDGDLDTTTAEITNLAYDGDWLEINFEQTYQNGVDLDPDNEDNSDTDCGYWSSSDGSGIDKMYGSATYGGGDGKCEVDGPHGWWNVGLDWTSD